MVLVAIPNKNEKKFIEIASKLKENKLIFLYDSLEQAKQQPLDKNITHGFLIREKDKKKLISLVNKARSKKIKTYLEASKDPKTNRFLVERVVPDVIFNFEKNSRKDSMHYKRSGLDQVLCKLLVKKKITVGFSFSSILHAKKPRSSHRKNVAKHQIL